MAAARARRRPSTMMMEMIRDDLAALDIRHDVFFSERSLATGSVDAIAAMIADLRARDLVYEGRLRSAEGPAGRGLGGPRANSVPRDRLRRRRGPPAAEIRRLLHLLRLRHRLPRVEVRPRIRR